MRFSFCTGAVAALVVVCPSLAGAQEFGPLRQTVTMHEDPFAEARVAVRSSQYAQQDGSGAQGQTTGNDRLTGTSGTSSRRSVFDQAADLDPQNESVLAYSGQDSINQSAEERRRLSMLAATGQLPAASADGAQARAGARAEASATGGIRRGNFVLLPELEVGSVFSSNVQSSSPDGPDDVGLRLAPRIALRSDWSRHALAFEAESEFVFWNEQDKQNIANGSAAVSGRVDIRSTTTLDWSAGIGYSQSTISETEVPDTAIRPRMDTAYNVQARLTHAMGRVVAQATAAATWFRFGNVDLGLGAEEDNEDRNYVAPAAGLRIGYLMTPAVQPFVEVTYSPRIHDQSTDRNGIARDSQGVVLRSGIAFNDGSIWAGEVAARYEYRDYEDASLSAQSAFGADVNLTWNPSDLTAIVFTAASQIEESSDPSVSGATTWSGGVAVTHQLRDNFVAEAGFSAGYTYYDGVSNETVIGTSLGVAYAIHKEIELIAGYEYTVQNPGEADSYDEHRVSSGMRFKL